MREDALGKVGIEVEFDISLRSRAQSRLNPGFPTSILIAWPIHLTQKMTVYTPPSLVYRRGSITPSIHQSIDPTVFPWSNQACVVRDCLPTPVHSPVSPARDCSPTPVHSPMRPVTTEFKAFCACTVFLRELQWQQWQLCLLSVVSSQLGLVFFAVSNRSA